ncbi:hypothetical protein ACMHYB_31960 [Sorangium sp. So ce1128]
MAVRQGWSSTIPLESPSRWRETIDVGAPPDVPPSVEDKPPVDESDEAESPEIESDWALFVHAGDEYFEQGGGSSVGDDYSGTGGTLAAVLEHGVRLSDITGERPTPGVVSGSVMGDPVIVLRFNWSAAVARDFHEALELGGLEWHAGNHGEAFMLDLRAAMDVLALGAAVAVESGIGAAMVLGAVLPKLGGGASGSEAAGGVKIGGKAWEALEPRAKACQSRCEAVAQAIQRALGGEIKVITGPGRFLGRVRNSAGALANSAGDKARGWSNHHVVVKDGMVYDALTGPNGMATSAYKQLWEYGDVLDFGF